MELCTIGAILKQLRKEKKISLADMCKGLCNVAMASRIENGERIPNRKLIESLFERIGEKAPIEKVPTVKSDFDRRNLEFEMQSKVANANYDIIDLLDEYVSRKRTMNNLEEQFYQLYYSFYENRNLDKTENMLERLINALKITIEDYTINSPIPRYMTQTEFLIFNNIARQQYNLNQKLEAITLMESLQKHFELSFISKTEIARNMPVILFNLSNWKEMEGNQKIAIELSQYGEKICITHGNLTYLPYHIFNKGYCLAKIGNKKEAEKIISDSFQILDLMSKHDDTIYAAEIINKEFGFDFPTK